MARCLDLYPGLSPLARGTPRPILPLRRRYRFIPAGAGNTGGDRREQQRGAVYPRWRGEHCVVLRGAARTTGLSPLARGTQLRVQLDAGIDRFIPAGAGNTGSAESTKPSPPVYPRWRGEHTKDILLFYNSFLSTQQFTNFITTISHY